VGPSVNENPTVTLLHGDCRRMLSVLPQVDALVTDPPYGIGASTTQFQNPRKRGTAVAKSVDYGHSEWDNERCSKQTLNKLRALSKWQIIFGGNYFELPPTRCWLVWDKENGDNSYADCELAWTNLDKPVRRIYWRWQGMLQRGNDVRYHPTQKPEGVMQWAIGHLPEPKGVIMDPFMGSGTTGVAAVRMGWRFIGIEADEDYYKIARRRIHEATRQPDLFIEPSRETEPKLL
jgi:DNA modification methylase